MLLMSSSSLGFPSFPMLLGSVRRFLWRRPTVLLQCMKEDVEDLPEKKEVLYVDLLKKHLCPRIDLHMQAELRPILLRRMKEDVEQLPEKEEVVVRVQLTAQQRHFYKAIFAKQARALLFVSVAMLGAASAHAAAAVGVLPWMRPSAPAPLETCLKPLPTHLSSTRIFGEFIPGQKNGEFGAYNFIKLYDRRGEKRQNLGFKSDPFQVREISSHRKETLI